MHHYGARIRTHWATYAPTRLAALQDPEAFFTMLGVEMQGEVLELAARLEQNPALLAPTQHETGQTYLRDVARRMTTRRIAEEIVMAQHRELTWIHDPVLTIEEAREEWEQTRPADDGLIAWAERMQDSPFPAYLTSDLEDMAEEWAVPLSFLEELLEAPIPRQYARANHAVLAEAANIRFLREVETR